MYNRNEKKSSEKYLKYFLVFFFTDVIQMILVIIKHKEMVGKIYEMTGESHNDK